MPSITFVTALESPYRMREAAGESDGEHKGAGHSQRESQGNSRNQDTVTSPERMKDIDLEFSRNRMLRAVALPALLELARSSGSSAATGACPFPARPAVWLTKWRPVITVWCRIEWCR